MWFFAYSLKVAETSLNSFFLFDHRYKFYSAHVYSPVNISQELGGHIPKKQLMHISFNVSVKYSGRPTLGSSCDRTNDCDGFGVICISGTCRCHKDYQQATDPESKANYCTKRIF